jgi:hypothetical protein
MRRVCLRPIKLGAFSPKKEKNLYDVQQPGMDWIGNAIICVCPLDRRSRDGCLGLHWPLKKPANVSNLLSPYEGMGIRESEGSTPRVLSLLARRVGRGITLRQLLRERRLSPDSARPARPANSVDSGPCIPLFGSRLGLDSHVTRSVGAFLLSGSEYRTRHRAGRCGRFPQDPRP